MTIEQQVDEILVELWNDIVNRQAGKIIFENASDILTARVKLLQIINPTTATKGEVDR